VKPRSDILRDKKCIHIKLDKKVHAALRAKLFKFNISMQEVFNEFAAGVAAEDNRSNRILESIVSKKIKDALENPPELRKRKDIGFGELDADALYNLISEDNEEEEPPRVKPGANKNEAA
jgi:hypothetical protein